MSTGELLAACSPAHSPNAASGLRIAWRIPDPNQRGCNENSIEFGRTLGVALLATAFAAMPSATAQAGTITYTAVLTGPNEAPPNASPGTGFATVVYDDIAHTLLVSATFQDLIGTTTAAHIHAATTAAGTGTAGVATTVPTFVGFPLGVTSGVYLNKLDLTLASSWNPSFVTAHGGTPGA